jgi:hypothetical protein
MTFKKCVCSDGSSCGEFWRLLHGGLVALGSCRTLRDQAGVQFWDRVTPEVEAVVVLGGRLVLGGWREHLVHNVAHVGVAAITNIVKLLRLKGTWFNQDQKITKT